MHLSKSKAQDFWTFQNEVFTPAVSEGNQEIERLYEIQEALLQLSTSSAKC